MRIQHNIAAMNAYRNYGNNVKAVNANLEKLSSGYKINRAGDDAAGLAISEKMRAQITGLNAAQKNVKDGISLVKTAEGALTEVHDMLNRMDYLATQSANGTYDNETDRYQLQKELNQLRSEINRIADSSNFNGINLLDGSMSSDGTVDAFTDVNLTAVRDAKEVKEPAKGKYELDISQAKWSANEKNATLKFSIGAGKDVTIKLPTKSDSVTGAQVAQQWMEAQKDRQVEIDGKKFNITHDGNGKLTFTGVDTTLFNSGSSPMSDSEIKVSTDGSSKLVENYEGETAGNQGWGQALTMIEEPASSTGTPYAQATFEFGKDITIADGTSIRIGDQTYTLAVGKNSMFKGSDKAIDLTDMEVGDERLNAAAAARLTQAAQTNTAVEINHDTNSGLVYLTEKSGGIDRNEYDLFGAKTGSGEADMIDATWRSNSRSFVQVGQSAVTGTALTLQIGDTAASYNQLKVNISDCHTKAMGISDIDISSQAGAADAIAKIKSAINYISDVRGTLGATQNRLDHTANNLSVMTENIQDAESTIRDTDVAEEMMAYTKNNILVQSAQAMLAQANQIPQGVLQLLG